MHSMFSYLKTMLRTFISIILTKNTKIYPSRIRTRDLWIKRAMCYQDTILPIQLMENKIKNHLIKA